MQVFPGTKLHGIQGIVVEKMNDSLTHKAMKMSEELHKCCNPIVRVVNF
jgi:hypothetical protein